MAKFDPSNLPKTPPGGRDWLIDTTNAEKGWTPEETAEYNRLSGLAEKAELPSEGYDRLSELRKLRFERIKEAVNSKYGSSGGKPASNSEIPPRTEPTSKIYEEGDIARAFAAVSEEGASASSAESGSPVPPPLPPPPPPRKPLGPSGGPGYRYRIRHVPDSASGGSGGGGSGNSPPPDYPDPPDMPEHEGPDEIIPFRRTTTARHLEREEEKEDRRRKRREAREERREDEREERGEEMRKLFGEKWGSKLAKFGDSTNMNQQQMGMLVGQATGMDSWAASIGGTNPLMIAAQVMKNKLGDIKEGLGSERGGKQLAGMGGMMETAGMATATPMLAVPGAFVKAIGDATDKIQEWSESLHKSNIQFAEFSAAMTSVKVRQEIRDIFFSRDRGNARAASAEGLAESKHKLREALAPIEDAFANLKNSLMTKLNEWFVWIIEALKGILKKMKVDLPLPTEAGSGLGGIHAFVTVAANEYLRSVPGRFR